MEDQSIEPAEVELSSQALSTTTGVPAPSDMPPPSRVGLLVSLAIRHCLPSLPPIDDDELDVYVYNNRLFRSPSFRLTSPPGHEPEHGCCMAPNRHGFAAASIYGCIPQVYSHAAPIRLHVRASIYEGAASHLVTDAACTIFCIETPGEQAVVEKSLTDLVPPLFFSWAQIQNFEAQNNSGWHVSSTAPIIQPSAPSFPRDSPFLDSQPGVPSAPPAPPDFGGPPPPYPGLDIGVGRHFGPGRVGECVDVSAMVPAQRAIAVEARGVVEERSMQVNEHTVPRCLGSGV
jgi:hypothetical protein